MSDYNLVQRGVIQATSADGTGPKDATLASNVKPASSFVTATVKEQRISALHSVQRGTVALTNADSSPKDVTISSVDVAASFVTLHYRELRGTTPASRGIVAKLQDATTLRLEFAALAAGETIDLAWEVVTAKPTLRRQATVRLLNANTVRLEWDGALAAGETIDAAYEVYDLENLGDDIKECLYRLQRLLGYKGENCVQDNILYDDAGNMTQFRLRVFTSKANAEAATIDIADGSALETGEIARVTITQDIQIGKNDRLSLIKVLTDLLANPDIN